MDSKILILVSCFVLTCAASNFGNFHPAFMSTPDSEEEYLKEEEKAINQLVPLEDVIKFWNSSLVIPNFGVSWIVFPDGQGTPSVGLINDESKNEEDALSGALRFFVDTKEATENVIFYLYNRNNPDGVNFKLGSLDTIEFPKKDGVKIICHGWRADIDAAIIQNIKDAYLAEQDVNVIGVDWSYGSKSVFYTECAKRTPFVGETVATLINNLAEKFQTPYEDVHIIGHSLGAHIAGFAGRKTKSKIGRISGLDPALPGFQFLSIAGGRLNKTDAKFVDVIHSCASSLGMSIPVGHVDFYPNGGSPLQPGCPEKPSKEFPVGLDIVACSHSRSFQYFEESVKKDSNFSAIQCNSWEDFTKHNCLGAIVTMGEKVPTNITGTFYLKTKNEPPFALGVGGTVF